MKVDRQLRDRLIALAGCTAHQGRPVIAAICFEAETAVATDAYVLGCVPLDDGPAEPVLVPAKPLAQTLRRASKKAEVEIEFGDRIVVTVTTAMLGGDAVERTELPPTEGEFPAWRKLFPERSKPLGAMPMFAPEKVNQVARLRGDKDRPVYLTWDTESDGRPGPMVIHDVGGDVLGLVMPTSEVPEATS